MFFDYFVFDRFWGISLDFPEHIASHFIIRFYINYWLRIIYTIKSFPEMGLV